MARMLCRPQLDPILQDNGLWVEGDDGFLWARGDVQVTFSVNPDYTTTVSYPPPDSPCAGPENQFADLEVVKDGPTAITLPVGQDTAPIDYTLTVTNNGPSTAADVMLVETLPDGIQGATLTTPVGSCSDDTQTCALGDIAAGDQIVVTVAATAVAAAGDELVNVVEVTSGTADPNPDNNRDEVTTTINRAATPLPVPPPPLPATGLDLGLIGLVAALLVLAGLASREVARARDVPRRKP